MKLLRPTLGVITIVVLLLYMFSFVVPFNETVLITTFGRADQAGVRNSAGDESGLFWRWPWPIQKLYRFDRRIRVLSESLEQQETSDRQVIVVQGYVSWKIINCLDFFRSMKTVEEAERLLRDRMRTACSELGNFRFDQLISIEGAHVEKAEKAILERMRLDLEGRRWGIALERMGISRVLFPEKITEAVFQRMRQTRQRMAQKARSEGEAIAKGIMAKAASDSDRIMAFARRRAQEIRSEGDALAAGYAEAFALHQDFALYLRQLETLENTLQHNTTFILDSGMAPYSLLDEMLSHSSRNKEAKRP
ncbi:hypothetical protein L2W58_09350 [Dethiosulfovibrio sp. F2B]|uniref:SPFH domain-containing protein n=1 Tax=Dethiosulfovibrio faecalis TaxID=2720018 RepID=UPI001EFF5754|nr:SPFH domain-containing protein [Dethiosulfovibrio faecalis]MCF4152001.1 hypothetical protein [Dethiosulfovibrio faecalis]